jgi:hypothetical protein
MISLTGSLLTIQVSGPLWPPFNSIVANRSHQKGVVMAASVALRNAVNLGDAIGWVLL